MLIHRGGCTRKKNILGVQNGLPVCSERGLHEAGLNVYPGMGAVFDALKARLLKESSWLAARKFGKREISLLYRGLEIKVNAETTAAELDLRTAATLKARLASCGKVVALDFENEILRVPGPELANSTPLTHGDGSPSLDRLSLVPSFETSSSLCLVLCPLNPTP